MKVYVFYRENVTDGCSETHIDVFDSEEKALAAFNAWKEAEKLNIPLDWAVEDHENGYFEAYEDGYYCANHSIGSVGEKEVK